jgi:CBS domain containing-hemolysin-like protein
VTGLAIPDDPAYETVGGYVMAKLGRIAVVGDEVVGDEVGVGEVRVRVERIDGRRVERVRVWAEGAS